MWHTLGVEALPQVLYHYTSIETLGKILKFSSLRFSRLDKVNDPEEALAADLPYASTSIFVSCWSADAAESIPMWSMYGSAFQGVRIRLPYNMFAGRHEPMVFEEGGAIVRVDGQWEITRASPALGSLGSALIGPNKVFYSNDPQYRSRKSIRREGAIAHYLPYDLGMVKSERWSYEGEWRFKTAALPFAAQFPDDDYFNRVTIDLKKYPVQEESVFVPLDRSAFEDLEVVLGPKVGVAEARHLEKILKTQAPSASIVSSSISIR
jgi:hypothetical protein